MTYGFEEFHCHVLSFEGPDGYARAGGIASRITGLSEALAEAGHPTRLWFVGDPSLPGFETRGALSLRRWCQWISAYHPGGVYDGEEGKLNDFASSLPPYLVREEILPALRRERARVVVLAEEWHTANAVLHLDWLLRRHGVRNRVRILWNANNTFGFERIDWQRLRQAADITTVSRYMRQRMWALGVDPIVIPNGLSPAAFREPERSLTLEFRRRLRDRLALAKVARWDPDKRWLLAIDTVAELRRLGSRPLLIARGGIEAHGIEVVQRARRLGLRVVERALQGGGAEALLPALSDADRADVLILRSPLDGDCCRLLFRSADAVLANAGHEPFGYVGLETMSVGGLACTGGTGEEYVVPGWNSIVLQTEEAMEFPRHYFALQARPEALGQLRKRARETAARFAWNEVIERSLLPHLLDVPPLGSLGTGATRPVDARRPRWNFDWSRGNARPLLPGYAA